ADAFVERILVERLRVSGAVVGFNFHFGKDRAGSPAYLEAEGEKRGFSVDIVPVFTRNGRPVSSGPIREALAAGDVTVAADLLGYPWFVTATVIPGDRRGRGLGLPTANVLPGPAVLLPPGNHARRVAPTE